MGNVVIGHNISMISMVTLSPILSHDNRGQRFSMQKNLNLAGFVDLEMWNLSNDSAHG